MTKPTADPRRVLDEVHPQVTRLAEDLYQLEADPSMKAVVDSGGLTGSSAALVGDARGRMQSLWERYSLLTSAVGQLEAAAGSRDAEEAGRLVGPGAVELPDGTTTTIAELVTTLRGDLDGLLSACRRLADAWRDVIPRLDDAAQEVSRAVEAADAIGVGHDPVFLSARRRVDQLTATAATDPLSADPAGAERAAQRAQARARELSDQRAGLEDRLQAAHELLDDLARLIPAGRQALAEARTKVADPTGLLEPMDPAEIDAGDNGLRPWLSRLEALAGRGSWLRAAEGLRQWEEVAQGWLRNARAVVSANGAGVARRDELRGLLEAYAAKAAATGQAEAPALSALHGRARDALYTAPCHLDGAADLVARYGEAVRAGEDPEATPPPAPG